MNHININAALAEAFQIALERMLDKGVLYSDMRTFTEVGDGGGVIMYYCHNPSRNIEVVIGGACTDATEVYNKVVAVNEDIPQQEFMQYVKGER